MVCVLRKGVISDITTEDIVLLEFGSLEMSRRAGILDVLCKKIQPRSHRGTPWDVRNSAGCYSRRTV